MKVVFFERKPNQVYFSLEGLFKTIKNHLPGYIQVETFTSNYLSTGLLNRIKICWDAFKHQGDLNHITGDIHFAALFLNKQKTILTIHDCRHIQEIRSIKNFIYWLFWFYLPVHRVRAVTVISQATKSELLKVVKVDPQKIHVIHNCVSPVFKPSPKKFNKQEPVILQIGTSINKNLENLSSALTGIPCKLVIVGKLNDATRSMLDRKGIHFENKFNLSEEDLYNEYCKADLVSFISTYEGFGLPIIEANATGRPVITSNVSSMPEVSGDGALLVNPHSIEDIRNGILKIVGEDTFRDNLIAKGYDNIKRFQPESIALQYAQLYNSLHHDPSR